MECIGANNRPAHICTIASLRGYPIIYRSNARPPHRQTINKNSAPPKITEFFIHPMDNRRP